MRLLFPSEQQGKWLLKVPIPLDGEEGPLVTITHPDGEVCVVYDPTRAIGITIPEFGVADGQVELGVPGIP